MVLSHGTGVRLPVGLPICMIINLPTLLRRILAPIVFFGTGMLGLFIIFLFAGTMDNFTMNCSYYTVNDLGQYRTDMLGNGMDQDTLERTISTIRKQPWDSITSCGQKKFLGLAWRYGLSPGMTLYIVLALGVILLITANWMTNVVDGLARARFIFSVFFDHIRQSIFWYVMIGFGIFFGMAHGFVVDANPRFLLGLTILTLFPASNVIYLVIRNFRRRTVIMV